MILKPKFKIRIINILKHYQEFVFLTWKILFLCMNSSFSLYFIEILCVHPLPYHLKIKTTQLLTHQALN